MAIELPPFRNPTRDEYRQRQDEAARRITPNTGYHAFYDLRRAARELAVRPRSPRTIPRFLQLGAVLYGQSSSQGEIEMALSVPHDFAPIYPIEGGDRGGRELVSFVPKDGIWIPASPLFLAFEGGRNVEKVKPAAGYLIRMCSLNGRVSDYTAQPPLPRSH